MFCPGGRNHKTWIVHKGGFFEISRTLKLLNTYRHGRRNGGQRFPLVFVILHFFITLLQKRLFFKFREGKTKFCQFWPPPWKTLLGYLWKNPSLIPPGKKSSDDHAYGKINWLQCSHIVHTCDGDRNGGFAPWPGSPTQPGTGLLQHPRDQHLTSSKKRREFGFSRTGDLATGIAYRYFV